jgi:hypothetical protein
MTSEKQTTEFTENTEKQMVSVRSVFSVVKHPHPRCALPLPVRERVGVRVNSNPRLQLRGDEAGHHRLACAASEIIFG